MVARRATFKQADLTRALRGARKAGLEPRGCRVNPATGDIEMQFGDGPAVASNSFDRLRAVQ